MATIYKNKQAKEELMALYNEKLEHLNIDYTNIDIETQYGKTRIIKTGNPKGKPIVLFHGYNAGSPLTLEAVNALRSTYEFYAIDTIGQTTKSAETLLPIHNDSFALWADEVLKKLNFSKVDIIGISYGAFILQKLITHKPQRINTCIFVVPSGIVNGNPWKALTKLSLPLLKYKLTKSDKDLKHFTDAFAPKGDVFMFRLLKAIMTGVKMDTRIPRLLKRKHVEHFNNPVYIIAASNDVYFPGHKIAKKSPTLFNNLKEIHILNGSNHMPGKETFPEIQSKIAKWVN